MIKKNITVIFEDYSTLKELKAGNVLMWISLIVLGALFMPAILMFLYFALFGYLPNMNIPEFLRPIFGIGSIFIVNIILSCGFHKPIKVYKEGLDLGTSGSLGWEKALFLSVLFYFKPTRFLPWDNIQSIEKSLNITGTEILKVTDKNNNVFYCTFGETTK